MDALFEAGCDDMTFQGDETGPAYAEVTRGGASFLEVALSAIHDIEEVEGLVVEAVDAGELVTATEIAERLSRTRESVRLLIAGDRGPGGFPAPRLRLRDRTKLWLWSDVAAWSNEHLGTSFEPGVTREAATLNAALALRRGESDLGRREREALLELVRV